MRKTKLSLNEVFKPNSLRNMETKNKNPMPHTGQTFYIWVEYYGENHMNIELKEHLDKGNKWAHAVCSINSYITVSDKFEEEHGYAFLIYGPGSKSSSRTVRVVIRDDDTTRITASGWGSTVCELYDGDTETVLNYFKQNQKKD